ncbi:MAG TPA: TIGR00366 family protein [Blastocatellia bacterium]|nr:TIGR00366 family protein [Blastocatellia bacterium]
MSTSQVTEAPPAPTQQSKLEIFAQVMGRFVPDAITASVILLVLLTGMAMALGNGAAKTLDAYYQGLWMLLPFTMQMTLIIVLSTVLGATPFFKSGITRLSHLPNTQFQAIALSVLVTAVSAYFYWGLGIAMTPLVAVHFAREAERKGIKLDFLFLLALLWAANAAWQFGLSSSAPLLMATPGHFLEKNIGILPLSTTIWSPAAIILEITFVGILMVVGFLLMPKEGRPVSMFPDACKLSEEEKPIDPGAANFSESLERNPIIPLLICVALVGWLYNHFGRKHLSLDINALNTILLFSCLLLHRTIYRFTQALQHAVVSCWPVIIIYHLYAGVAGLIQFTSVGEVLAGIVSSVSTPYSFPFIAAVSGTIVAIFVPSSGGQWVIQGYVTSTAAMAAGVTVQRGLLALSIGDHMGNLVAPFWYVIVAGVARVNFREFFGYGLIFALLWFLLGVLIFTFAPC